MTYQLQNLTPPQIARLDEVPIARQEQIIDQTGEPLRLVTSYYLVKNASANFTVPHETAENLDAAIYGLLTRKGFLNGTMQVAKPEPIKQEPAQAKMDLPEPAQPVAVKPATPKPAERPKPFSFNNYPLAKKFMPPHQQLVVSLFNEEREAILSEVEKMLSAIPKFRSQSKKPLMEQTVYAHYFYGQSDWFILEYDGSEDMFFGYVILNGDSQMSESGFIGRQEITENGRVELDFHWKPVALGEALYNADPDHFKAPKKKDVSETTTEQLIGIGFDQKSQYTLAAWNKALPVMEWLVRNTPFVVPHDFGPGKGKYKTTRNVSNSYLADLYDRKIEVPDPKFKKGNMAQYKDTPVQILDEGTFDTVARHWVYLAQAYQWADPDNVSEKSLTPIEHTDWNGFVEGQSYRHNNGKTYQFDGLIEVGDGQKIATWKLDGKRIGAPIPNLPGYFKTESAAIEAPPVVDNSKRLRLAQAKAKAQAARIRILKLKSQQAA